MVFKIIFSIAVIEWVSIFDISAQKISWYSTTSSVRWEEKKVPFEQKNGMIPDICISSDSLLQEVTGFGGTFNEIGWDALCSLPQGKKEEVMASLFSKDGVCFSLGRLPIGSSDYAFGYYSYNEVKDDYAMRNFSIDRDRFILIPYVKEALKFRPDLKLWASLWTPPAWMKVNEHYSQKSSGIERTDIGHNRLDPLRNVLGNVTGFKMQQGYL